MKFYHANYLFMMGFNCAIPDILVSLDSLLRVKFLFVSQSHQFQLLLFVIPFFNIFFLLFSASQYKYIFLKFRSIFIYLLSFYTLF